MRPRVGSVRSAPFFFTQFWYAWGESRAQGPRDTGRSGWQRGLVGETWEDAPRRDRAWLLGVLGLSPEPNSA